VQKRNGERKECEKKENKTKQNKTKEVRTYQHIEVVKVRYLNLDLDLL
jgi:hypothetical protein